MALYPGETVVAMGFDDESGYVGIVPPLSREEIRTLEWVGYLEEGMVEQVEGPDINYSLIQAGIDLERAEEVATKITLALHATRGSGVRRESRIAQLTEDNRSPFDFDIDD